MEKFNFLYVKFEQNFMQFAKWYDFFAQGFIIILNCVTELKAGSSVFLT